MAARKANPKKTGERKALAGKALVKKASTKKAAPIKRQGKTPAPKKAAAKAPAPKKSATKKPMRHERRPGKRLKKSVAARAVAQAEALLQLEKDQAQSRIQRVKDRERAAAAQKREKKRAAQAAERAARLLEQKNEKERKARAIKEARDAREAARATLLDERAERRAAREKEKELTQARKKSDARAKKKAKLLLKEVARDLNENRRYQQKRLGASSAELTRSLLDALSMRADVEITVDRRGPALLPASLATFAEDVPPDVLAWYGDLGPIEFSWSCSVGGALAASGRLEIPPLRELTWTPRGRYLLSTVPGKEPTEWLSLEEFVTTGGQTLWTWNEASTSLHSLAENAAPAHTSTELIKARLAEKGVAEKYASGLVHWLGTRAHLLLHATEVPEGRRRRSLTAQADGDGREVNSGHLALLNSGAPVDKPEWKAALRNHARFVSAGGAGGRWAFEIEHGLPVAKYLPDKPPAPPGQANFAYENLSGLKHKSVQLLSANLTGVRAEGISFSQADLSGSTLMYAWLEKAEFSGANLANCDFTGARLAGADFRRANLKGTSFENADLTGANFAGCVTAGTRFGGANVKRIKY